MTLTCQGCGAELPPPKRKSGRRRKWCSQRCRKQTLYTGNCIDCGERPGYSGTATPSSRCVSCSVAHRTVWTKETILQAIRAWADAHGGVPPAASDWNPTVARERGKDERGSDYPPTETVRCVFGRWRDAISAAGFDAFKPGHYGRDGEDPAVVAETVRLYRSGLSAAQVGARLGVAPRTVLDRLAKAGEQARSLADAQALRRAA